MAQRAGERALSRKFPPEPMSVRAARAFVCDTLTRMGWSESADTAAIAVSELATNVVLHARTDFTVSVRPIDDARVRIEVRDGSPAMPVVQRADPNAALGRGLRLVEDSTDAWGVERVIDDDPAGPGKSVWFELGNGGEQPLIGDPAASDYDPTVTDLLRDGAVPPHALVEVALLRMPLQLFARETTRHRELMREMALIALSEDVGTHHVPFALTQLAAELEQYRGVGAATDATRDAAILRGDTTMDLSYRLPPAVGPACRRLNELLDEAEAYCRAENLLTLAGTSDGVALRNWYLTQIADQIDGASPTPWAGAA